MSCWVCSEQTAFIDHYLVHWCQEHIDIHTQVWLEAIERTADDPSF